MASNLYRGKFIISIYNENDDLIAVCDNAADFARLFNKSLKVSISMLSKLFNKKLLSFYSDHHRYKAVFIED